MTIYVCVIEEPGIIEIRNLHELSLSQLYVLLFLKTSET